METTIHERSAIKRELEVKIPENEVAEAIDEAYKTLRPKLALPGFRPGKAPLGLLKKMHGESIEGDALEKLAQDKFQEAVKELDLKPIGMPVMVDLHRHAGEGAHFRVAYEIAPEFELQTYDDITVDRPVYDITDEDIEERVQRILFTQSEREPAEAVSSEQAVVTIDMEEQKPQSDDDTPPSRSQDIEVYLADPEIVPQLKERLLSAKTGEEFEIELPKHRKSTEAGAPEEREMGRVKITVKNIQTVKLPALDKELIEKITRGKLTTEEELRKDMREELSRTFAERAEESVEESIVTKLLEKHEFEVPRTITRAIIDQMLEEAREHNTRNGYPANYGIDEDDYRKRMAPVAEARGKWVLLRDKLIEAEGIKVTDEDLDELAAADAEKYGLPKENLLKYYQSNEQTKSRLESEKLGKLLREKVTITDKPIEKTK